MACFSTLPDDCVQLVFDRIPTEYLFKIGRVSRAWRRHQLLNCQRRKTLILLQGGRSGSNAQSVIEKSTFNRPFMAHHIDQNGNYRDYKSFFEYNQIYISVHKPLKVKVLVEAFPNLKNLIISTDQTYSAYLRSFIQLITSYSSKLASLQIYFGDQLRSGTHIKSVEKIIGNLINQINSLTVLQHFTFFAPYWYIDSVIEAPEFIIRLKEFYFNCRGLEDAMFHWVQKYDQAGSLNQLVRIYIINYLLFRIADNLPTKFDHIPVTNCFAFIPISFLYYQEEIDEEYLKRIVANFSSLTTFTYTLGTMDSLTKLATILSSLTKLVHIGLTIELATPIEPLEPIFTVQQKSIKALDLDFPGRYEDCSVYENFLQSQITTIVHTFPSLQSIQITPDKYTDGDIHEDYYIVRNLRILAGQFFDNLKAAYGRSTLRTKYCSCD